MDSMKSHIPSHYLVTPSPAKLDKLAEAQFSEARNVESNSMLEHDYEAEFYYLAGVITYLSKCKN